MTEWLLVLAGVGLTAGTALFVATEFSLVALDRPTVQKAIDTGDRRAEVVLEVAAAPVDPALGRPGRHHADHPGPRLHRPPASAGCCRIPLSRARPQVEALASVAAALALLIVTLFSMVLGELMPQFLGIAAPLATAKVVAVPVRAFAVVARPLIVVLNGSANPLLGHGHHAAGGAVRRPHPAGARLASVRRSAEAGHARRRHRHGC